MMHYGIKKIFIIRNTKLQIQIQIQIQIFIL